MEKTKTLVKVRSTCSGVGAARSLREDIAHIKRNYFRRTPLPPESSEDEEEEEQTRAMSHSHNIGSSYSGYGSGVQPADDLVGHRIDEDLRGLHLEHRKVERKPFK